MMRTILPMRLQPSRAPGVVAALGLILLIATPAIAATHFVSSLADDGSPGTLRTTIAGAAPGDSIEFSVTGTLTLALGVLSVDHALTITGPAAPGITVENAAGSAEIFDVGANGNLTLRSLAIRNPDGNADPGPQIANAGSLRIEDCDLQGGTSGFASNGTDGVSNTGDLTLVGSDFTDHAIALANSGSATVHDATLIALAGTGGFGTPRPPGIENSVGADLVVTESAIGPFALFDEAEFHSYEIANAGVLRVRESTITGCRTENAASGELELERTDVTGDCSLEVILDNEGDLRMSASSFCDAVAIGDVGLVNSGSAVIDGSTFCRNSNSFDVPVGISNTGALFMTNSTVSGNSSMASSVAGIRNSGSASLFNVTVTGNASFFLASLQNTAPGVVTYRNLIADHTPFSPGFGTTACGGTGTFITLGTNFSNDGTCPGSTMADPLLGPLADNGGPTLTHALLAGSPAIDAVVAPDCVFDDDQNGATPEVPLTVDQRMALRPNASACDAGAVEQGAVPAVPLHPWASGALAVAILLSGRARRAAQRARLGT